jgi:hypothetical protein
MGDLLDLSAGRLDTLAGYLRKAVGTHRQGVRQIAIGKNLHQLGIIQQAGRDQLVGPDQASFLEAGQIAKVDWLVLDSIAIDEPTPIGEPLDQRELAALEVRRDAAPGAGLLALGPLAGRGAPTRAEASTESTARLAGAFWRAQLMKFHSTT